MKKVVLLAALLLFTFEIQNSSSAHGYQIQPKIIRADFKTVYERIRSFEGNYVFHPNDKGGETYAGVTRAYSPNWRGWTHIDALKKVGHEFKWNERVEDAEFWVLDFYLDIWVKEGFDKIEDQELANYLFDIRVNSGKRTVIHLCNKIFKQMELSLKFKSKHHMWLEDTINNIPKTEFLEKLKHERIKFYHWLVKKDETQKVFLGHWLKRAKDIS